MISKVVLVALCLVIAATAAPPQAGLGPPSWLASAPWMPQWTSCDPATQSGSTCSDCSARLVCTKVGGLVRPCDDPALPHCNLGQCVATPSAECAAAAAAAAPAP